MTVYHGKSGSVSFNSGAVFGVRNWTLTCEVDMVPATNMLATSTSYLPGLKNWTANVDCLIQHDGLDPDHSTDLTDADGASLILTSGAAGTRKYTGTALVTNIATSTDLNDYAMVTYSFQGSGELTETEVT